MTKAACGVGRFQTAKVFLLTDEEVQVGQPRCWSLSNSEGVSPYPPQHIDYKINLDYFSVGNVF